MDGKGQDTPALDKQGHRKNRKLMIGRQLGRQIDRQVSRQTDRWIHRQINRDRQEDKIDRYDRQIR